jgi:putative SOS response-associated peptidase YedK
VCAAKLVRTLLFWAKVGFATSNAKAEGIDTRTALREAFQRRRCLVPVYSY